MCFSLAILDPTLSFQKFSSGSMTAVNLWLSDVLELNFLPAGKAYFEKAGTVFFNM